MVLSCLIHCVNINRKYISAPILLNHSFKMLVCNLLTVSKHFFFFNFTTSHEFKSILKVFNSNTV